jgi:thiol-disulfide isomerase/thioredoxin
MHGQARTMFALVALFLGFLWGPPCHAQRTQPPAEGAPFPDIRIPAPSSEESRGYLGLKGKEAFKVGQIDAEMVIVEVFSMYCPHCQREAPSVNSLYRIIDGRPDLKGKIKIMGIGAGNTGFEVDLFSKKYGILFPLIPDPDLNLHRVLGEVRTPYFIAVKLGKDGQQKVLYSQAGSPGEPDKFLESLLKAAKGK